MPPANDIPIIEDLEFVMPPAPVPWGLIAAATVGAIAVGYLVAVLVRALRARRTRIALATRPQRRALAHLKEAFGRWRETGYMAFMFQVTSITRTYLAERFGMRAPCRTTREIARAAEAVSEMPTRAKDNLADLLQRCDLIKFAAELTVAGDVEGLYHTARDFVEDTAWRN